MAKRLEELINFLENNVNALLKSHQIIKEELRITQEALKKEKTANQLLELAVKESKNQQKALKNANALLGSDDHKKETRLKINELIREIDQCIAQLSEMEYERNAKN